MPTIFREKNLARKLKSIDVEELDSVIKNSVTFEEVMSKLGFSNAISNRRRFILRAQELGLDINHLLKTRTKRSNVWKVSQKEFEDIVNSSNSIGEALSRFGLRNAGGNHLTFKERAQFLKVDLTCLYERTRARQIEKLKNGMQVLKPEDLFVNGKNRNGSTLKNAILRLGLLENKCSICGILPVWNGKPFSMQLDHKNGDRFDNRLENLRLLCPICHAQTDTFCGKNIKNTRTVTNGLLPQSIKIKFVKNAGNKRVLPQGPFVLNVQTGAGQNFQ